MRQKKKKFHRNYSRHIHSKKFQNNNMMAHAEIIRLN